MPRYAVKILAIVEAKDEAEAAGMAAKASAALAGSYARLYFQGQGINLVAARVDPKPTRE